MRTSDTINDLMRDVVVTFARYRLTGTRKWSYRTALTDLQYQLGTLSKYIMYLDGERNGGDIPQREIRTKIADELADIIADVLFISHELEINLPAAWKEMLASDSQKIEARAATAHQI